MNSTVVKIQIAGLPAIFPASDYVGKLQTYQRIILIGNHSEVVVTEDAFRTIYDNNYQQRTVQAVIYNKYQLRMPANEYLRVDLIEHAKYVYVTTQDEVQHKAKILSVTYTKQDSTELGEYDIEYADINPVNYKNQTLPINNFLESEELRNEFEYEQLVNITYEITEFSTIPKTYYTELLPEEDINEPQEEKEEINGKEVVTRSVMTRVLNARFYLKTEDKNLMTRRLSWADVVTITSASGTYTASERILPEVKSVGINLFQIDIKMKYQINNYYPENQ